MAGEVVNGGTNNVWNVGFDYYALPQLDINGGVWYIRDPHNSDNHALLGALTTRYFLSKATSLYMQVGAVTTTAARDSMSIDNALYGVPGTTVGAIVGINKRF